MTIQKLGFVGIILVGGLIGGLLVSLPAAVHLWRIAPQMGNEGQFGMIFIVPWAIGWFVGSGLGSLVAFDDIEEEKRPLNAWLLCLLLVVTGVPGGLVAGGILGIVVLTLRAIYGLLTGT